MAIIEVNFISKCLMRVVTFNAIIPVDKFGPQAENAEQKPLKTLYLLHGIFGNYTDWVNGTRIQAWAEANDLAVIMPSGENRFSVLIFSRGTPSARLCCQDAATQGWTFGSRMPSSVNFS